MKSFFASHRFYICQGRFLENLNNQTSFTVIAPVGHTSTQLSQPKHSSILTGSDLPSLISKTLAGQVSTHSPLPSHFSLSTVTWYIAYFFHLPHDIIFFILLLISPYLNDDHHKKLHLRTKANISIIFMACQSKNF